MTDITQDYDNQRSLTRGASMGTSPKIWDKIADKYAKSPIKNMDAYTQTMDRTKAHLTQEDSVLEIGCGTGTTALLLADSVKHITASDISSNMLGIGNTKARAQPVKNVNFVQADVFDDTLAPGSFDVILAFNLLHLVEDLPAVIRRINTLLRPDGRLISKTECLAEQTRLWSVPLFIMRMVGFAPYVNCLTFDELEGTVSGENFQIIETELFDGSPRSRFIVAKKI